MSAAILPLFPNASVPAVRQVDPFDLLPQHAQVAAKARLALLQPAITKVANGCPVKSAARWLSTQLGGDPSMQSIQRWLGAYAESGLMGLATRHKGRVRQAGGWEAKAAEYYNAPQRPAYSTVALWLRQEGFADATDHGVRRYLQSLPSNLSETGRKRLGAHFYDQNVRPHVVRDMSVLPVGFIYEGDGHTCDVYVQEPSTGNPFRPELTVWVDVRSHYVVGWYLSDRESANTTLYSLSHAFIRHDHVPAMVHCDPGSGFIAKIISDETVGFISRFSIKPIVALPGNAKGKGLIEGFFRWFEERCGKRFRTFCGHCRTDNELSRMRDKIRAGELKLPTLQQYADAVRDYFDFYNANPQAGLGKVSPASLWATLDRVPLELPAAAVMRPRDRRKVQRWGVRLHGRLYRHGELARYEAREVTIEYDLHNDSVVWIQDDKGRFICEAGLVEKKPWLPDSRIEEAQQDRLAGQQARLQRKLDEVAGRAHTPFGALTDLTPEPAALPASTEAVADLVANRFEPKAKAKPLPAPAVSRPVDELVMAGVREAMADPAPPLETAEQRFARYLQLRDQVELAEGDADWLATYRRSAECQGLQTMFDAFGYVPGVSLSSDQERANG